MAKKQTRGITSKITDKVQESYGKAHDNLIDVKDKTENTIKNYPLTSIAIAAGIGAIIGLTAGLTISSRFHHKTSFWDKLTDWF